MFRLLSRSTGPSTPSELYQQICTPFLRRPLLFKSFCIVERKKKKNLPSSRSSSWNQEDIFYDFTDLAPCSSTFSMNPQHFFVFIVLQEDEHRCFSSFPTFFRVAAMWTLLLWWSSHSFKNMKRCKDKLDLGSHKSWSVERGKIKNNNVTPLLKRREHQNDLSLDALCWSTRRPVWTSPGFLASFLWHCYARRKSNVVGWGELVAVFFN